MLRLVEGEKHPGWWEGSALYCVTARNPETEVPRGCADLGCEACVIGF